MGKIDILDRQFFAEPARFAELINTELYQGGSSAAKAVAAVKAELSFTGISIRENCTEHRKRKDYKEYWDRKSRMKRSDLLIPAMTMVLYLGEILSGNAVQREA